jgi:TolB-like protein
MANIFTELKKRKVFNSAAIYLATAFVILQVAQIIIPALHIPSWTLSFIVVLLILGFPIVVIFSWIYDVSDDGVVRTDAVSDEPQSEKAPPSMARSSLVGIVFSIVITIFMAYKGIDYFTATKEVTGKTSIAVLNFDNVRKFQDYEWLGDDIAGSLSYKLGGIPEVRVIDRFQILNKLGEVDPEKASILEYKINQIANNIDVDLILHGQFTILDSIVKVIAFYADTKTFSQTRLMNEKYSLNELSDIPTYINDKISDFIKNDPRFKENSK